MNADIFTRYVLEEPSQADALEKGMTWGRRVGTGERVLIAQVPGEDDPGSRAARLYADALRLEAGALARCDGAAGLLRVLERGEDALGRPVAVFAPAGGVPLSALLEERGRLTFEDARAIALQACGALDALHREGCVHANVKPRTILVERVEGSYRATLRFSGIAMPNGPRPDTGGIVFGTTGYMAPEQLMSEKAMGPRADLFSLACTLLECLTGQPAFSPELREFFGSVTRSPAGVTALGELGAVHPSLRIVLERALQASPDMRQRTCADFARELAALGEARPRRPVDPPPPSPEDARRPGPLRVRPPLPPASRTSPGGGRTIAARYRVGEARRRDGVYTSYEGFDLVAREPVEVAIFEPAASYGGTVSVSALVDHLHALYDRPRQRVQRVRDLGELDSGGVYVVMDDLGELPTLWEIMDRGPMRYQTSRGVLAGAAAALEAIQDLRHEVVHPGLIHVIVREDHSSDVVLSGVDLCEVCLENEDPELNTYPAGLFQYMAPEVLQGGARRTPASAVWNLGVLAYLLETNQLPFGQGAAMHVLERVMTARPKPFASFIVGGHDHAVEEAVFRCLERDPAGRHASIADAARALGFEGF